jgi:NADPH:quinone reductase-like Zn-dependent oxidoreductase
MAGGPGLTESESTVLPRQLPDPRPQADEVLVRVRAAGINPVDWKIRQGQLRFILRSKFPFGVTVRASDAIVVNAAPSSYSPMAVT